VVELSKSSIASQFSMKRSNSTEDCSMGSNHIWSISRCHFLGVVGSRTSISSAPAKD
jgi:hypothetical protein